MNLRALLLRYIAHRFNAEAVAREIGLDGRRVREMVKEAMRKHPDLAKAVPRWKRPD